MLFIGETLVFVQLIWVALFGVNGAYLDIENYDLQEVLLQAPNQLSQGNNVYMLLTLAQTGLFQEKHAFL
jgi:hypothetical protein